MSLHNSDQSAEIIANLERENAQLMERLEECSGNEDYLIEEIARLERHLHEAEEAGRRLAKQLFEAERANVTVTTNESGDVVAVTRTDSEHRIVSVIWERKPVEVKP